MFFRGEGAPNVVDILTTQVPTLGPCGTPPEFFSLTFRKLDGVVFLMKRNSHWQAYVGLHVAPCEFLLTCIMHDIIHNEVRTKSNSAYCMQSKTFNARAVLPRRSRCIDWIYRHTPQFAYRSNPPVLCMASGHILQWERPSFLLPEIRMKSKPWEIWEESTIEMNWQYLGWGVEAVCGSLAQQLLDISYKYTVL